MSKNFTIGTLVFAKLPGYPYWPGLISSPNEKLKKDPAASKSGYHCVFFFGSRNFSWIEGDKLKLYEENKEKIIKKTQTAAFRKACRDIDRYDKKGLSIEALFDDDFDNILSGLSPIPARLLKNVSLNASKSKPLAKDKVNQLKSFKTKLATPMKSKLSKPVQIKHIMPVGTPFISSEGDHYTPINEELPTDVPTPMDEEICSVKGKLLTPIKKKLSTPVDPKNPKFMKIELSMPMKAKLSNPKKALYSKPIEEYFIPEPLQSEESSVSRPNTDKLNMPQKLHVSTKFTEGTLVLAKLGGYPYWPGIICPPTERLKTDPISSNPDFKCIFFFGSRNFSWINENKLKLYKECKGKINKKTQNAAFRKACKEIDQFDKKGLTVDVLFVSDFDYTLFGSSSSSDEFAPEVLQASSSNALNTHVQMCPTSEKSASSKPTDLIILLKDLLESYKNQ